MRLQPLLPAAVLPAVLILAAFPVSAFGQETLPPPAPGEGRVVFQHETPVSDEVRDQFEANFEWGETQAERDAQAQAEAETAAAEAAEKARLEAELEQARMEAAQAKAELEAARAQAEADAKAAEEARMAAEEQAKAAEEARQQAEAEAKAAEEARQAEAEKRKEEERKRAEAEAAQKRAEEKAEADAAQAAANAEEAAADAEMAAAEEADAAEAAPEESEEAIEPVDEPAPAPRVRPTGTVASVNIDPNATLDGAAGIAVSVSGEASRIRGTRIETAVYFFDAAGKALRDTDKQFRSSQGQVYVGEYRTADAEPYAWTESLFIPRDQLELGDAGGESAQAQVTVWEYSDRKGQILAQTEKQTFSLVPPPPTPQEIAATIAGAWSDGVTIAVDGDVITVTGLDVRGTIESAQWTLTGTILTGVLEVSRRIGADRTATYEFILSEDGNTLNGTYVVAAGDEGEVRDEGTVTLTR